MGATPIPCVPPPVPTRMELFVSEITPPRDYLTPIIGWSITLLLAALPFVVALWVTL